MKKDKINLSNYGTSVMPDKEKIDEILKQNKEDWRGTNNNLNKARHNGRARVNNPKYVHFNISQEKWDNIFK